MLTYSLLFKIEAKSGPRRVSRGRPVLGACGGYYGGAGDGHLLHTGAANVSASGLKRQDNDLIVIESAEAAGAFRRAFDTRFASGGA